MILPLLLQRAPESDPGSLLEGLFKFLIFAVFFGLPILRSVLEARKKARARDAQAPSEGADAEEERRAQAAEARRRWEALLRGESPEGAPAAPAPAAPPPLPASRTEREGDRAPPPLVLFDTSGTSEEELEAEGAGDEERRAREELDRRLREERSRREILTERPAREEALTMSQVAPPAGGFELAVQEPSAAETVQRRRYSRGGTGGGYRLGDLRRAVIASEILGPPVSSRGPGGARAMFDRGE